MPSSPLKISSRVLRLHKAVVSPEFDSKNVLARDHWNFVEMWLRRHGHHNALKYWSQSRAFYQVSGSIPDNASPLTLYYSFLNATKALLSVKGRGFTEAHGTTGRQGPGRTGLSNEIVRLRPRGILSALCDYFSEPCNNEDYQLKDIIYNLPFIHRCFKLTYPTGPYRELFIPISAPCFRLKDGDHQAWISAELSGSKAGQHTLNMLAPLGFERDLGIQSACIIRTRQRFDWHRSGPRRDTNVSRLIRYHRKLRKTIQYIPGTSTLWYVKRTDQPHAIDRNPLTLIYAAMHRFSELSRYNPTSLARHLDMKQNWLISEFVREAPYVFIDQIASEITNLNFMPPAVRHPGAPN